MEKITFEFPENTPLSEMIHGVRREWARREIRSDETIREFTERLGVSYRTGLRWLGRLGVRERPWLLREAAGFVSEPIELPLPIVWDKDQFSAFQGPVVYAFVCDMSVLYVGCSKNGARRFLDINHHRKFGCETATHVYIYPFHSHAAALKAEKQLIAQHQPKWNNHP